MTGFVVQAQTFPIIKVEFVFKILLINKKFKSN